METTANLQIGERVRVLRRRQRRTLDNLAERCGYSKSLLSKIENGRVVPSIGALVRIATALGTTVSALIATANDSHAEYTPRSDSYERITETPSGLLVFPFATEHSNNKMQPVLHVARKGKVKLGVDSHEGQEFIYILKGTLKFQVGSIDYTLREGDSIYFDSLEKHQGTPLTDIVEYLDIFV